MTSSELYPNLHKDNAMSNNSNGGFGKVIIPEVTMAIGICILVGASYLEVKTTNGVGESSVFLSRNIFSHAINTCDTLKIVFPEKEEDYKTVQIRYQARTSHCPMKGCIGYILDELLIDIKCSAKKGCGNTPAHIILDITAVFLA